MSEPNEQQPLAFGLKPGVIHEMTRVFASHPEVEQVILYGSRATGNFKAGSDIDICMSGQDLTISLLLRIDTELDDLLLPYKIDLSILDHINNPDLLAHIQRAGVCFYRR
ncbi:putative nucleotidyltransferase [Duganella sp. 1411]|uniref:nucleotidyltransferase domain-containing protein n=1 Tax=Duganella sp. 1411 TaxID=2806572 RepID=UPI001AE9EC56|nr:nucleotidyltransferase domain-containing protein [Duganella sp. 1411]MBP1204104.1 putative nucleotidyltransferase [Duganella sp. 1411]